METSSVNLDERARKRLLRLFTARIAQLTPDDVVSLPVVQTLIEPARELLVEPEPSSFDEPKLSSFSENDASISLDVEPESIPAEEERREERAVKITPAIVLSVLVLSLCGWGFAWSHGVLSNRFPPDGSLAFWQLSPFSISSLFVKMRFHKWALFTAILSESVGLLFLLLLWFVRVHLWRLSLPSFEARVWWDVRVMTVLLTGIGAALASILMIPMIFSLAPGSEMLHARLFVWWLSRYFLVLVLQVALVGGLCLRVRLWMESRGC